MIGDKTPAATSADVPENSMTQGLLVVGLLFELGFLTADGVHSALRDFLARQLYPRHLYEDEDSSETLSKEDAPIHVADRISRDSRA